MSGRFGSHFRTVFLASLLQELSFSLMLHFPGYAEELGATESRIGLLYSVAAVAALATRPAFGRVLDLVARRSVLLATGLASTLVLLGLVVADSWGPRLWSLFLVYRVLQILLFTAMLTAAADVLPAAHRARGLAIFGLSGLVPIALGGALGDLVLRVADFDALFVAAAAASVGSWVLVWRLPLGAPEPEEGHDEHDRRSFWAALRQRDLLPLWLATFCFALGLESIFTFLRVYVEAEDVGSAGVFFALYGVTGAVTRIAGRGLYERVLPRAFVAAALVGYAAGLAVLAMATPLALGAAAVVCGAAHGAIFPMLSSQVVARARITERGSAMSIFTSVFDVALLAGARTSGGLIESRGYSWTWTALAAVLLVGAAVYAIWDRGPARAATSVPSAP